MRRLADLELIQRFMVALARRTTHPARLYFTGGATAVLFGWRASTIDVDILFVPEDDALLRALPALKEELQINLELACPAHFIPELPGWDARSVFIAQDGQLGFFHYDFNAQALAKIERGHTVDMSDVQEMFRRGLINAPQLMEFFDAIAPQLHRYPAIDSPAFRRAVEKAVSAFQKIET
jgi:hypothetical protein